MTEELKMSTNTKDAAVNLPTAKLQMIKEHEMSTNKRNAAVKLHAVMDNVVKDIEPEIAAVKKEYVKKFNSPSRQWG